AVNNSTVGQFQGGHYTLEISTSGAGSAAGATVTIRLRDHNGDLVTIDADGATGGDVGTVLTTTISVGATGVFLDLGGGLVVSLNGISTGTSEAALWSFDFTQAGNSVSSQGNAQLFMEQIDTAISKVSEALGYIGAIQNRLSFQEASLSVAQTNTLASYNRIMNADMAYEQLEATKLQILQQTATVMLATANMMPQYVLALFGG
ncbi:MAG TPA: hypothetical protein EYP17_08380, partial [Candidatus Latescibacteria bacterium]|nr:hypothetical protein [Candidatus Latescibacterota bacterium]